MTPAASAPESTPGCEAGGPSSHPQRTGYCISCAHQSFEALFKSNPRKLPIKNPDSLKPLPKMYEEFNRVLELEDASAVQAFKSEWEKNVSACKALTSSITKGDAAIKSHIGNQRNKIARDLKQAKTDSEKKQLQEAKAKAQAVAARLRAPKEHSEDWSLARVPLDAFIMIETIADADTSRSHGVPLVYKSSSSIDSWVAMSIVQSEMPSFGGTYNKSADIQATA